MIENKSVTIVCETNVFTSIHLTMDRNEVIQQLEDDEFFRCFLQNNAKSDLAKCLTITEQVKKLGEGIELLSQELQKQVLEKHEDLLRQAHHATKLENVLNTMNTHVKNLFANAERLKNQIDGPYNALEMHTKILGRLHLASHILRQVNRIQQLSKRLSNTNDPIQKATILQELEQLASDEELKDIEAVTIELRNIREHQHKVINLATGSLNQGIKNENVSQTTTALQIFINLGTLDNTIKKLVNQSLDECKESLKLAFDLNSGMGISNKNKGTPGRVTLTSSQGFRNRIWTELEKTFGEEIYQQCKQIKFIQKSLTSMNIEESYDNIACEFWEKLCTIIEEEIANSASAVQQMLEEDYPKLLKNFFEMIKKLNFTPFTFHRQVLDKYENSYLSTSLNRLLEPTQTMFNLENNNAPTSEQIDSLVRSISNELSMALVEDHLIEKVSKNVSNCIKMFAVKTEQQLETGPEVAQVIAGSPNSGQIKNLQLANALYYLHQQIQRMIANMKESLPEAGIEIINDSLLALNSLTVAIIQPLVDSIKSTVETIIVTIHLENDWAKLQTPANKNQISSSPYMKELNQFIARVHQTYLASFENKEVLSTKCCEIAVRSIELLVRHSSLIRPISQGGRMRLQADYSQLEESLKIMCPQISDLGRPYRLLRSMASLLVLSPQEILTSQISGSSVPHSTVLLMLFSFAGSELASPHQNIGWSLPKLSSWLDEHPSESERIDLIVGAVQRYETVVRKKNSATYDPVYPIMSQLIEVAIKSLSDS